MPSTEGEALVSVPIFHKVKLILNVEVYSHDITIVTI